MKLTELRKLLEEATKGPWRSGRSGRNVLSPAGEEVLDVWDFDVGMETALANRELVLAAVNALPALIEVAAKSQMLVDHIHNGRVMVRSDVDRLRAALARLEAP